MNFSEYQKQAAAGYEPKIIHKASFIERRLFYLTRYCIIILLSGSMSKLCYKGMQ